MKTLWNDENGVILSAELVLIGTILVLGMIVGLVELQCAVVGELSDLGDAIGNVDQSYVIPGMTSYKRSGGIKARTAGARYNDFPDEGDCNAIITCDSGRTLNRGEKSNFGQAGSGHQGSGHSGRATDRSHDSHPHGRSGHDQQRDHGQRDRRSDKNPKGGQRDDRAHRDRGQPRSHQNYGSGVRD